MALYIKDSETDRIARELAAVTGETITVAVRISLEERLRRVRASGAEASVRDELDGIIARGRARRVRDRRAADEVVGYDDHGLPA